MKLQKLDDLLLNLVVAFEARRIKSVTPLRAAEATKQLVIRVKSGKISVLILIAYRHPQLQREKCMNSLARSAHCFCGFHVLLVVLRARSPCARRILDTGVDTRAL